MAATKIFPITDTTHKALAYIAADNKTDNGRFVSTFMCSRDPDKAAKEFAEVTATETGRSTVLAQHFIISFKPGEVTPEPAKGKSHWEWDMNRQGLWWKAKLKYTQGFR